MIIISSEVMFTFSKKRCLKAITDYNGGNLDSTNWYQTDNYTEKLMLI